MTAKRKGLISAMIVLCLIMALLGGCSKNQNHGLDPSNPTTITIWHYYNGVQQEHFDKLLIEFNETVGHEQGIVVEAHNKNTISDLADSAMASLREDAGAEEAPDMFASYAETAYAADQLGKVADLSAYFTQKELEEYVEGYLEEGRLDDQDALKLFPVAKSTEVMMLNVTDWQDFADAAGVSVEDLSTWEGLAETAAKYYAYTDALTPDVPNDGKAFFGHDSIANYMNIGAKQLGLEYFSSEDGKVTMNTDKQAIRRLWDGYYAPYVSGYYLQDGRYRSDDAQIGEIIAMVCSTPGSTYFPRFVTLDDEHTYAVENLVLPVPNFEGTEPYIVQQGAGMVVVKSDEKTEYACSEFLKWFTEKERSIDFSASSGYLPVKKDANDFDAIAASFVADGDAINEMLFGVMEVAVSEINDYHLYASKPFENASVVRDFLGNFIQETAQASYDAAAARIENGEDRDAVLSEYLSDEAFDAWYEEFISGIQAAAGI